MVREAKKIYMKRFLDPNLPPKQLWRNIDVVGAKVTTDMIILFFHLTCERGAGFSAWTFVIFIVHK
jgi:hypothetical protein